MREFLKEIGCAVKHTLNNEHGFIGTALAVASLAVGVYGVTKKTKAKEKGAKENVEAMLLSASRMEANATAAEQAAEFRRKQLQLQRRRLTGRQVAGYGKAGVVLSEGTPLIVMEETQALATLDELAALYTGKVQAEEYRNIATEYRYQAEAIKKGGQAAASAGRVELAQTILSGAENIYSAYKAG